MLQIEKKTHNFCWHTWPQHFSILKSVSSSPAILFAMGRHSFDAQREMQNERLEMAYFDIEGESTRTHTSQSSKLSKLCLQNTVQITDESRCLILWD